MSELTNEQALILPVIVFVFASILTGNAIIGLLLTAMLFWLA